MKRLTAAWFLTLGLALGFPTMAQGQATRTWVSATGDDVNPCSRTAPCKTFAGAISKTAAGGAINPQDNGSFGAVTITKSMTIRAAAVEAGVLASLSTGIFINAGPNDRVVLEGLDIDGGTNAAAGLNGIRIAQAGEVIISNCVIRNFVNFANPSNGAGILIDSASKVRVTILNSVINNNLYGVRMPLAGSINPSGIGDGHVKIFDTRFIANSTAGLSIAGANNDAVIAGNRFIGPKSLEILSGAKVASYGDNVLTSGDNPTSALPQR